MVRIMNVGNTCYFNSILQIFFNTNYGKELSTRNINKKNYIKQVFFELINIAKNSGDKEMFNPLQLLHLLKWNQIFEKDRPHDAHEAILHLINIVNCEDFQGEIIELMYTQTKPIEQIVKQEVFNSLEITINNSDFNNCLKEYFNIEIIANWKDSSGKIRELIKSSKINKSPSKILFVMRQSYYSKTKIEFPISIDISEFCTINSIGINKQEYVIYSIVVHTGSHYYTYIFVNSIWKKYDDDVVQEVSYQEVSSDNPYMIIYEKKDITI